MKHAASKAALLFLLALPAGHALAAPEEDPNATRGVLVDGIVAVVGEDVILRSELEFKMEQLRRNLQQRGAQIPPRDIFEKQVLERLIDQELQLQWAEQVGLQISDDQLNQAINTIAQRNEVTLEELPRVLAAEGVDYPTFRQQVREDMLLAQVKEAAVDSRINVLPQELDEYMRRAKTEGGDQQFRIAHILLAMPGQVSPYQAESVLRKMKGIRDEITRGDISFEDAAVAYSDGQQALQGGDLGWRTPADIPSLFSDIVLEMEVGEVSEPIRSGSGYHLVMLVDAKRPDRVVATETNSRHILLEPSAILTKEQAIKQLREIKKRIEAGEDFEALAREFSDDPGSASQGGNLGWNPPGTFAQGFQDTLDQLEPGEISDPFETQFGIHIAQLIDRRETDFTDRVQRNRAYQAIIARKAEAQFPIWLQKQRDDTFIENRLD